MERSRTDLISKKLGELLLGGFRMLNETCENCDVSKTTKINKILIEKLIIFEFSASWCKKGMNQNIVSAVKIKVNKGKIKFQTINIAKLI